MEQEKVDFGTAVSSKIPRLELIPKEALISLAGRFELGIERHPEKHWNALSTNRYSALTREFLLARMAHVVHHAYDAIYKIKNDSTYSEEDDAGAILFGGAALACYTEIMKRPSASTVR
jgi:hypothetical protein